MAFAGLDDEEIVRVKRFGESLPATPNYSLSGSGFNDFNVASVDEPVWDEATQGYKDKWGNYSYDGGNSWGAVKPYTPPQNYDLSGSGFNDFNVASVDEPVWNPDGSYTDKWGNVSYDAGATWQSPGLPQDYGLNGGGFDDFNVSQYVPEMPSPDRASFLDYDLYNPQPSPNAGNPWDAKNNYNLDTPQLDANNVAQGFSPSLTSPWDARFESEPESDGFFEKAWDVTNFATPGGRPVRDLVDRVTGQDTSDIWNKYNEYIGNPLAETGAQVTGLTPNPGLGKLWSMAGVGDAPEKGWQDFGSALKDSGGNPLEFARIQNENFGERPWYEQLGSQAVFDPTNAIPFNVGAKAVGQYGDDVIDIGRRIADNPNVAKIISGESGEATAGFGSGGDIVNLARRKLRDAGRWVTGDEAIGVTPFHTGAPTVDVHIAPDGTIRSVDKQPDSLGQFEVVTFKPTGPSQWEPSGFEYFASHEEAIASIPVGKVSDTALNGPRRKLLDALDSERKFRTSGQAADLIAQGRKTQAEGIAGATGNLGDDFAENVGAIMGGAKTGPMLPSTQGLGLDDATLNELLKEAIDFNGPRQFDNLRAIKALDKLNNGTRLQPAEIKALRQIYGDEVAEAVARTNAGRIQTVADLTDEDMVQIARKAEIDGKRIATLEVEAQRQHELAGKLAEQSRMAPTNKALKKAAEDARARAISKENRADELLAERAENWSAAQAKKADAAAQRAARLENKAGDAQIRAEDDAIAAAKRQKEDEWIRGLDDPTATDPMARSLQREQDWMARQQERARLGQREQTFDEWARDLDGGGRDPNAEWLARQEAKDTKKLGEQQARAKAVQTDRRATAEYKESGAAALDEAHKIIDKADVSPAMKQAAKDAADVWLRGNAAILDGMGDAGPGIIRRIYAAAVGEVSDSWTSKLLTERAFLQNGLEQQGLSPEMAGKVADQMQKVELARRFGGTIPKHVQDSLDQAVGATRGADGKVIRNAKGDIQRDAGHTVAAGAADISQSLKNTTLGIGDLAAFGQNGAKLTLTNAPQILAGIVNRTLNLAHLGIDTGFAANNLPRHVQKALDGVKGSSAGITDLSSEGTVLSLFGKAGRYVDSKTLIPITKFLTDLQFKHVLGFARDLAFEGNLAIAKLVGDDVTDAAVRQRAADWANVASGAANLAQRAGRKEGEKALMLSPGLTRAQIQQWGQVARALGPGASRAERVYAAMTVASASVGTLMVGKYLNDQFGLEEFEFDPSKPGFGDITLPGGTVVNVFSQEQVLKTVARSFRVLAEEPPGETDWGKIAEEWGKFGIGRASPVIRLGAAAFGTGYQPGEGYKFGDLDMSPKDMAASTLLPPIAQSTMREGVDKVRTPLSAIGVNTFEESDYNILDRKVRGDASLEDYRIDASKPVSYQNLSPKGQQLAEAKYGKLEPFGPEGERSAAMTAELTDQQKASDDMLAKGSLSPAEWWNDYKDRKTERWARNDEIYKGVDFGDSKDPILNDYYAAISRAEGKDGKVDWDRVEKYTDKLPRAEQRYIEENTGLVKIDTPQTRAFEKINGQIEKAGWYERTDDTWDTVSKTLGIKGYDSYYDWRDEERRKLLEATGNDLSDVGAVARANAFLDKQAPAVGMTKLSAQWREQFALEHPQEAYHAWQMGIWDNPPKKVQVFLAGQFE